MRPNLFLVFCLLLFFTSCNKSEQNEQITSKRIEINPSIEEDKGISDFITPFKNNIEKNLNEVLCFSVKELSKRDGELNTALGNLMADAVLEESDPIFNKRTGQHIDFVILNHGGIRSSLPKGDITIRNAFQLMPFENEVVVVALKGQEINEMLRYLERAKRAHPISKQLRISLDSQNKIQSASIHGKNIDIDKTYYVATSDYLFNGGDGMDFLSKNETDWVIDYKIRNVLIDHFRKLDTLNPTADNRFVKVK